MQNLIYKTFPVSTSYLTHANAEEALLRTSTIAPEQFPDQLQEYAESGAIPPFLPDLARTEWLCDLTRQADAPKQPEPQDNLQINPTLQAIKVDWQGLPDLLDGKEITPQLEPQVLLFWQHPNTGTTRIAEASPTELLALKIISEKLDQVEVATAGSKPVAAIDTVIDQAVKKGLLLQPPSRLRRQFDHLPEQAPDEQHPYLAAEVFTLQWHITHRCDLHCRHCYDRSQRNDVSLAKGIDTLDQMRRFCRDHYVAGQVSFSGGNPFLHTDFLELYRAAHERNLNLAILGNPVSTEQLDTLLQIARPAFFQVSLEGLEEHNDRIRGQGSFQAVLKFLELLQERGIYSMVMLTLTRANLDQVLPLAEVLRDRADLFTYNRLAMVGEGARLESPQPNEYHRFAIDYLNARKDNPVMALKDSLLNIELERQGVQLFGGCTGFGCGAAFNFVSLLPDGQVHACRKFPSPIGDLNQQSLHDVYHSAEAEAYRRGCYECDDCRLRLTCGGCLAVSHGWGLQPLKSKDPDCFL